MSSSILQTKPEHLDTAEKRGKYTISIVGCGQDGLLQACLLAEAGYKIICTDPDAAVTINIAKGKTTCLSSETEAQLKTHIRKTNITTTNDSKTAASQSDIVIIAVPARIDGKKKIDYSEIENLCKRIGPGLRRGSLVIVSTVTGLDITYGLVKELLENSSGCRVGIDLGLAYSPMFVAQDCRLDVLMNNDRLVAAADRTSLEVASAIVASTSKSLRKTDDLKQAEAAVLFEYAKLDTNAALAKEFALFCEKAGIDYSEASKLMNNIHDNTNTSALADDGTQLQTYLLLEDAEDLNTKLRIPTVAREVNEGIVGHAINLVKDALHDCGKTFRRARVSLLGISQAANMKARPKDAARRLLKSLEDRGAKVSLYDPYFAGADVFDMSSGCKKSLAEALEGADCIIILTGHDQFKRLNLKKLKLMMRKPAAIVDLERIVEPEKAEKEGFIYRGLGKGVLTK